MRVRKEFRRKEAEARQEAWQKLSVREQLAALDSRPGGSKKQRARLEALLKQRPPVPEQSTSGSENNRVKAKDRRAVERSKSHNK